MFGECVEVVECENNKGGGRFFIGMTQLRASVTASPHHSPSNNTRDTQLHARAKGLTVELGSLAVSLGSLGSLGR